MQQGGGGGGSSSSIASRVTNRKRARVAGGLAALFATHRATAADGFDNHPTAARAASRRRLMAAADDSSHRRVDDGRRAGGGTRSRPRPTASSSSSSSPSQGPRQQYIAIIQSKLAKHKHHGTGNPLAVRSPTTPKTLAIDNLAAIIQSGHLGQDRTDISGSIPQLRTERGRLNSGSFWVSSVDFAGHYGWTGLILPPDVDTSGALPISDVCWFVVETDEERGRLETLLLKGTTGGGESECADSTRWDEVKDRVVTLSQLAERLVGT